ncbi:acyltransferase [Alkalicoccus urumqiensis]|uniref:Acyltransferase n=1 Tax=Alkalicoccus urumqiensis TaxID=1548213 RepID=A0A2P6ML58_ALKUR|nr:acyltransferase [Alkalicoccus urumqiensis]PRO67003.1 acyltransferase [Alkalicoccus urumqiensis]
MAKRTQIDELFVVRALAIIGVLVVHSTSSIVFQLDQSSSFWSTYNFMNTFFKIGTTTFIFLSAFVLFYNYYTRPVTRKLITNFYKRRLLYILIPYIVFSAVYFYLVAYLNGTLTSPASMIPDLLALLATGNAYTHLYFVFISVQFFLMFPLFLWAFKRWPVLAKNIFWIGILLQWIFVFYNNMSLRNTTPGNLSIWYASYYFLGAWLGMYYDRFAAYFKVKRSELFSKKAFFWFPLWGLWLAGVIGHVGIYYLERTQGAIFDSKLYSLVWNMHTLPTALILLQLSYWIYAVWPRWSVNTLIHLGVVSFGVYISHPLVLLFYRMTEVPGNPVLYHAWVFGGFLSALIIPWIIVGLVMRWIPGGWVLFGTGPKRIPYKKSGEPSYNENSVRRHA